MIINSTICIIHFTGNYVILTYLLTYWVELGCSSKTYYSRGYYQIFSKERYTVKIKHLLVSI